MGAGLRLGPLLRYTEWPHGTRATVWVETGRPCTAEVRCADGAGGRTRTFHIAGHHYALIPVTGLTPGTATAYEVLLDGRRVWPLPGSPFPPSSITAPGPGTGGPRLTFGSCRWAADGARGRRPAGPDALGALAARLAADPGAARPDALLLLGDQVYADRLSAATRRSLAARRDLRDASPGSRLRASRAYPKGAQVADFEEYTRLYGESWGEPRVRWLLSTVPSLMIFDDHDVIDDWNTSAAWAADLRATPWWRERLVSGLMAYWVYQHLGNLSPGELATDPLYGEVRAAPDGTEALRRFAAGAGEDPSRARWSYRRDFGRTRLVMVDGRAGRVLDEEKRSVLDGGHARWVREQVLADRGGVDHLLVGSALPWLLPPLVHDAEQWNAALCRGGRGERWARAGEVLRRASDLEHWAAFPASFEWLTGLLAEAAAEPGGPATVAVLSGDVHHSYVAEPERPGTGGGRVMQLTCSPVHQWIPYALQLGFRFGWSRAGRALGRALTRHGRTGPSGVAWRRTGGPWFGNQLMTLALHGRRARLLLEQAGRRGELTPVHEQSWGTPAAPSGPGRVPGPSPEAAPDPDPDPSEC
ncbi:alkaline phosphatase family protein [Streptomyces sp. MUM 203J]|uniref:alkaline phosphatase D family protein n=1 Tax=Streptomyces sp. MUM 203J TaxID=2791990 RepID=UPI001F04B9B8|nr:alkaline phosphatase D family protein [Streptomyces sp. MUM 203J]MCH0539012.1 alkaline phosphatase family protein [Streptomyces sp. MUM 203J]